MKLLFETGSTCIGGAERVLLRLAKGIREQHPDWQVDAIVLCRHGGIEAEYRQTFSRILEGPGDDRHGESGKWIAQAVGQFGYNIVHCIDSFTQTAEAARLCPQAKFIQAVYPNCRTSPFAPPAEWLADRDNPYAAFVTEFKANLQYIPRAGRPPHETIAIANGIDTEFWTPSCRERTERHYNWDSYPIGTKAHAYNGGHWTRTRRGWKWATGDTFPMPGGDAIGKCIELPPPERDIDVLWCARTDAEKGIDLAMELVPILCGRGIRFDIVTSEPDGPQEDLERLRARFKITFGLHARLPPDELRSLFRRSKVFLSTSTVEGMPATPLEAAACGCRPFVPYIDGLIDCFGGEPAFWYRRGVTAGKLAEWLANTVKGYGGFVDNTGTPARVIAERYSVERMVEQYIGLYERMVTA